MSGRPIRFGSLLGRALVLASAIAGCSSSSDGNGPSNALYSAWNATTFVAQGVDYIAGGMSLVLTLDANGTYQLDYTNDQIGACNPGPDCTDNGNFSSTSTQFTLDPAGPDPVTFDYTIQGTTLNLSGSVGNTPVTLTLEKL